MLEIALENANNIKRKNKRAPQAWTAQKRRRDRALKITCENVLAYIFECAFNMCIILMHRTCSKRNGEHFGVVLNNVQILTKQRFETAFISICAIASRSNVGLACNGSTGSWCGCLCASLFVLHVAVI